MIIEILIGIAAGAVIGGIISITIEAYTEYLTKKEAKRRAEKAAEREFKKLIIDSIHCDPVKGEVISARAIGFDDEVKANVEFRAKCSDIYTGDVIY